MDQNNNLYLCTSGVDEESKHIYGYPAFTFYQEVDSAANTDDFNEIFYDVIACFAKDHVTLYGEGYLVSKPARKRFFSEWQPAEFFDAIENSGLKLYLLENQLKNGVFAEKTSCRETKSLFRTLRDDWKDLLIVQENIDIDLLKKIDLSFEYGGDCRVAIAIFADQYIQHQGDTDSTIDYYVSRLISGGKQHEAFMLMIGADILLPRAYITLNSKYMSVEELIAKLKIVADKYHKNLIAKFQL